MPIASRSAPSARAAWVADAFMVAEAAMAVVDGDRRVAGANAAFCRLVGREQGEVVGRGWSELVGAGGGRGPAAGEVVRGADGVPLAVVRAVSPLQDRSAAKGHLLVTLGAPETSDAAGGRGRETALAPQPSPPADAGPGTPTDAIAERFRALVAQLPAVVYTRTAERVPRFLAVSPQAEAVLGITPEQLIAEPGRWRAAIHPDDLPGFLAQVDVVDRTGEPFLAEYRVRHRDGHWHWVRNSARLVRDAAGQPVVWQGIALDVTPEKAAAARQAYLLRLADALRPLTDPLAVQAEATRLLGEELGAGRVAYGLVADDDAHMVFARGHEAPGMPEVHGTHRMADYGPGLLAALTAGKTLVVPDTAASADLTPAEREGYAALGIAALVGVPLVKDGRLVATLVVHHAAPRAWTADEVALAEETAERTWSTVVRARAEARLHESETRLRALFDGVPDCVLVADGAGNYLDANRGATELLGYTREELLGLGVPDVVARSPEWTEAEYARYREQGTWRGDLDVRRKDGTIVSVEAWASVVPLPTGTVYLSVIRDITDRVAAETALRESEQRYRRLFEMMHEGFAGFDILRDDTGEVVDVRFRETNSALLKLTSIRREDFIGKRASEVLPEEDDWIGLNARAAAGETVRVERFSPTVGRWYAVSLYPDGPDRVACLYDDVTERKRREARQAFLLRLTDALRPLADPLAIEETATRLLGEHLGANRVRYAEIDGGESVIRRGWERGVDPFAVRVVYPAFGAMFGEAYRRGETVVIGDVRTEPRLSDDERARPLAAEVAAIIVVPLVKDGHLRATFAVHSAVPRAWAADEVALVEETAERIWETIERARAETALRESEARFWSAFEDAPIGMALIAADGRFLQVNAALARLSGYAPDELVGMTRQQITHPDDLAADIRDVDRLVRGEIATFQRETRYLRKDGSVVWTRLRVSKATDTEGRLRHLIAQIEDITEERRASEMAAALAAEQRTTAELQRLNKQKSDFVSVVSHELRTPLTSIRGYAELIGSGLLPVDETAESAQIIADSARRLNEMLNRMLDLDRLESGRAVHRREPVAVAEVVREAVAPFGLAQRTHPIRLDLDPAAPPVVGDRGRLLELVTNLVDNAIKYSPNGGEVTVSLRPEGEAIHLAVRDAGISIPASALEAVFERYSRVASTEALIHGTGLGLPICREIVERHGGRIWAERNPDAGTTMHVVLPLAGAPAGADGA